MAAVFKWSKRTRRRKAAKLVKEHPYKIVLFDVTKELPVYGDGLKLVITSKAKYYVNYEGIAQLIMWNKGLAKKMLEERVSIANILKFLRFETQQS